MCREAGSEYLVTGRRVGLRRRLDADAQLHYALWQDPVVWRNFNCRPRWQTFEDWQRWHTDPARPPGRLDATIVRLADHRPIGIIGLGPVNRDPDLSVIVHSDWRRQGYGTEAAGLILSYAFRQMQLKEITAGAYECNQASERMLEKLGFARDPAGDRQEQDVWQGGTTTQLAFRIDSDTWRQRQAPRPGPG